MLKKRSSKTVYKTVFVSTKKNEHLSNLLKNNYLKQSLDFVISHCFKKKKGNPLRSPPSSGALLSLNKPYFAAPPPKYMRCGGSKIQDLKGL